LPVYLFETINDNIETEGLEVLTLVIQEVYNCNSINLAYWLTSINFVSTISLCCQNVKCFLLTYRRDSCNIITTMSNDLQIAKPKKLNEFLSQNAVFTVAELDRFLSRIGSGNPNTRKSLLTYYHKKGRIIHVRRGIYAAIPLGSDPESYPVDPYLVAAKTTTDAVISYHTALEFYGKAYSAFTRLLYATKSKSLPFRFQSHEIRGVGVPPPLKKKGQDMFGVNTHNRSGVELRVTSLERTLVDVLNRPHLSGSWEEIWRSLESVEFFDLDQVAGYTLLLENATTAAKVGFFLEQHKETLMVDDSHLQPFLKLRPKQPHYLMRSRRGGCRWVKNWNLMVPIEILNKSWGEVL